MIDRAIDIFTNVLLGLVIALAGTVVVYLIADLILTWAEATP